METEWDTTRLTALSVFIRTTIHESFRKLRKFFMRLQQALDRKITNDFVDAVNPQFAILFGGRTARDKPSADLLSAFARTTILQTSERGTIEMIVEGNSLMVR